MLSFGATLCWFVDRVRLGIGGLSEPAGSSFYRHGKVSLPSNKIDYSFAHGY